MPKVKSVKRSKKGKKAASTKRVEKIAKRVLMKTAETKSPISNGSFTLTTQDDLRYQNIMYFMGQGSPAYSVIGEKIFIKNIRIMINIFWNGVASTPGTIGRNFDRVLRVMIIKTKTNLGTTTGTVTNTNVFRSDGNSTLFNLATRGHVDLHKVDLLHDEIIRIPARDMASTADVPSKILQKTINLKVNKTEFFDSDNSGTLSGFLKNKQYYLLATYDSVDTATNGITLAYQWAVNCKDV